MLVKRRVVLMEHSRPGHADCKCSEREWDITVTIAHVVIKAFSEQKMASPMVWAGSRGLQGLTMCLQQTVAEWNATLSCLLPR